MRAFFVLWAGLFLTPTLIAHSAHPATDGFGYCRYEIAASTPRRDDLPLQLSDFDFFLRHTNEKEVLLGALEQLLDPVDIDSKAIEFLDVGAADGSLAASLYSRIPWLQDRVKFTIVEPDSQAAGTAVFTLANLSRSPVTHYDETPDKFDQPFDVILASHVLYYVKDLVLKRLWDSLKPGGVLLISISNEHSDFTKIDRSYNRALNKQFKYKTVRDVEKFLSDLQLDYAIRRVHSTLRFPDIPGNRRRILRMHLGGNYDPNAEAGLFRLLDSFRKGAFIELTLRDNLYEVRKPDRE